MFIWKVKPTGKNPLVIVLDQFPLRMMLVVNGEPVGAYDPQLSGGTARWVLSVGQQIKAGMNELKLVILSNNGLISGGSGRNDLPTRVWDGLRVYRAKGNLTAKATWAFASWVVPQREEFHPVTKTKKLSQPCWYRCEFKLNRINAPLWLEPTGMTKGQLYINGHNAGRYLVSTSKGKTVGPQKRYLLPESWLHQDQPNELLIFDEHGANPSRCRLVHAEGAF